MIHPDFLVFGAVVLAGVAGVLGLRARRTLARKPAPADGITVIQVFRALDVVPEKELTWSVGSRVASMYIAEFGREPPKENRPKTGGGGTHCFAIYPASWFPRIAAVVAECGAIDSGQPDLFGGAK